VICCVWVAAASRACWGVISALADWPPEEQAVTRIAAAAERLRADNARVLEMDVM
jgi:hypothetical protein